MTKCKSEKVACPTKKGAHKSKVREKTFTEAKALQIRTMGLLKIFRSKQNTENKVAEGESKEVSTISGSSKNSNGTGKSHKSKAKQSSDVAETKPRNVKFVEKFVKVLNSHNKEKMHTLFTPDAVFVPEDVPAVPIAHLLNIVDLLIASFPDLAFSYKVIKEDGENLIVVENIQSSGTHTGAPYSPMPDKLEPVAATGKYIAVDDEHWYLEIEGGKIKKFSVIATGGCTGPVGMYERTLELSK